MVHLDGVLAFLKCFAIGSLLLLAFLLGRATKPGIHKYSERLHTQRKKLNSIKRYLRLITNLKTASQLSLVCLWSGCFALHSHFFVEHRRMLRELKVSQFSFRWLQQLWLPTAILLHAKVSIFCLRKGIDRMARHLTKKIGRLRNDEENYVKNVLNDLGEDLSLAIRDLQAKELSENNRKLERKLQGFETTAGEQLSELNLKQKTIEAYKQFNKSLDEFAWCSECMFWYFDHQEPALEPQPARLFDNSGLQEQASTKSDTQKLENLNNEKNSIKTSKSDTLNPIKNSKCTKKCIFRFLTLYELSKKSLDSCLETSNPLLSKVTLLIPKILSKK